MPAIAKVVDVVVVGGGPAGVFCAQEVLARVPTARVLLLEAQKELLKKVRLSGGGRCNVTHARHKFADVREVAAQYPRGGKQLLGSLSRFGIEESHAWFETRGVALKTEADGRVFPTTDSSATIVNALLDAAAGVEIQRRTKVVGLDRAADGSFIVTARAKANDHLATIRARCVVVATGSSVPFWNLLAQAPLGLAVAPPVPSLFTFKTNDSRLAGLAGISVDDAAISLPTLKKLPPVFGPTLVTHFGLSGPAVLRQSAFAALELHAADYRLPFTVDWTGGRFSVADARRLLQDQRRRHPARKVASQCPFVDDGRPLLAQRLWSRLALDTDVTWANAPNELLTTIATNVSACMMETTGKTTFKDEFVTAGGVEMRQLTKDFEASALPGLFFAGECLNVDGVTGGFNFTNCWSSGHIAAARIATLIS
ncbi:flavoprotein [Achlya hypogyna]|uniref:Flavoprotein n=1 Tax=Achlya hypogyna TaxID=1202772 RepID=A0A1V9Z4X1_ACHHY|nr:flavoprotein [Achlya hypogyna]